jgi:hypothetical protein
VDAATSPPASPAAEPVAPPAAAPAPADLAGLTRTLTDLVKRLAQADASRQAQLKGLAVQAQAQLKVNDAAGAEAAIERLRAALDEAGLDEPGLAAPPAAPADPAAAAAYAKARVAWLATRQKVESDIGKLQTTFASAFKDHAMAADLAAAFQGRVEKVLDQLDIELAHKLDAVAKAADPAQHAKLVGEARQIMQRYQSYVANDPTLAELDANPFVPLAIQKTLTTTLAILSKTIG